LLVICPEERSICMDMRPLAPVMNSAYTVEGAEEETDDC